MKKNLKIRSLRTFFMSIIALFILLQSGYGFDLNVGGWLSTRFFITDKAGDTNQGFDAHHLYLLFDGDLGSGWRAFSEIEFEHAPTVNSKAALGTIKIERLYTEYRSGHPYFNLMIGRFNTPVGIWTPAHWALLTETSQKPFHERDNLFAIKQVGVKYFAGYLGEKLEIPFSLYFTNGSQNMDTDHLTGETGHGADASVIYLERYKIGGSYLSTHDGDQKTFAVYSQLGFLEERLTVKSEFFHAIRKTADLSPWYGLVMYEIIEGLAIGFRHDDYLKPASKNMAVENLFANFNPIPRVKLKVEWNRFRHDGHTSDDYNGVQIFLGSQF